MTCIDPVGRHSPEDIGRTLRSEAHQRPFSLQTWLQEAEALGNNKEDQPPPTVRIGTVVCPDVTLLLEKTGMDLRKVPKLHNR